MKTNKFKFTIGINEGYFHNNKKQICFEDLYIDVAHQIYLSTNIFVSAIFYQSKALYNKQWGCPNGGEMTCTIEGYRNPAFCTSEEDWKRAVVLIVKALKEQLKQTTVALEFSMIEHVYMAE